MPNHKSSRRARPAYSDLRSYLADQKRKGVHQSDIAARLDMSEGYLSDLKKGRQQPSLKLAKRLAAECGIAIEGLIPELESLIS